MNIPSDQSASGNEKYHAWANPETKEIVIPATIPAHIGTAMTIAPGQRWADSGFVTQRIRFVAGWRCPPESNPSPVQNI
jgi:hypothetical protein